MLIVSTPTGHYMVPIIGVGSGAQGARAPTFHKSSDKVPLYSLTSPFSFMRMPLNTCVPHFLNASCVPGADQ